jgi:hypothetical protein
VKRLLNNLAWGVAWLVAVAVVVPLCNLLDWLTGSEENCPW